MNPVAQAVLYALFVWWFSTGAVLLLVLRKRRTVQATLVGAALLFPVCLYLLSKSSAQTSSLGVYVAFSAAILLWATQEIAFLTGFLTGPRVLPCPDGARGLRRAYFAVSAILYHEVALLVSGAAVVAVTWNAPNRFGTLTFLVLWAMRVSAKLNLFLGVPVLNDDVMPARIAHLRSYFTRGPVNGFFPIAVLLSVGLACAFGILAQDPDASPATEAGYVLVTTLTGLAILEHLFMLVPLPIDRLWRWSTFGTAAAPVRRGHAALPDDLADDRRVLPSPP